jgi:rubrerythrin
MEMITTKTELLERIKEVRAVEVHARDSYINDGKIFKDNNITGIIAKIRIDEEKHIAMLDEIINILEK